ncbi:GNAT family N-acetyltransferase, partial [Aphanothece microscopica]|uniref:GNAT family N-acetyltransferase n=1 Tax=Aphanothece microscopica TaxID=1049561 RepID=UPI0039852F62
MRARVAASEADRAATLALRHLCFIEAAGRTGRPDRLETDSFDDLCRHVLIEEAATGRLVCSYRVLALGSGAEMERSYSAQYYDLAPMASYPLPMIEVGRFCMRPGLRDADALRLAWGTLVRMVDGAG